MSSKILNELRSRLVRKGITWQQIADDLGVHRQTVWATVKGQRKNPAIRAAIAEAAGMPVERIWREKKVA